MDNILVAVLGILGAGFAAFGGSRIAIAELRKDTNRIEDKADTHARNLEDKIDGIARRVDRLEGPYFDRRSIPRSHDA